MAGSVFLSHASEDKPRIVSLGLIPALQRRGLTVLVDQPERFIGLSAESMASLQAIGLGEMWRRDLPRLLEQTGVVLACWSENYASRFNPDPKNPSQGQYVRDETEDARAGEYLVHVIIDPIGTFPAPYTTLRDKQYLELCLIEHDRVAIENGYDRLDKLIAGIIEWRRMKALGSFYEARAWAAVRLLDRGLQEEPLLPHVVQEPRPGLCILFAPAVEAPEQLYDRFCLFTMPANGERRKDRPWMDIARGYMSGALTLTPWQRPGVVSWPQVDPGARTSSYEEALRKIADQLYRAVPGDSSDGTDDPLRHVLESVKNSGEQTGTSYFAYSFIPAKRWASERATICPLIERLGSELASASVDNFRFLVVVGLPEARRGVLRWLLGRTSAASELGKKEGGPSPVDVEGRPIWYRLPDLTPVEKPDFDDWASLLSTAWGVEVERARHSVFESFSDKSTSFLQAADGLVKFVLPKLWLQALPNLK